MKLNQHTRNLSLLPRAPSPVLLPSLPITDRLHVSVIWVENGLWLHLPQCQRCNSSTETERGKEGRRNKGGGEGDNVRFFNFSFKISINGSNWSTLSQEPSFGPVTCDLQVMMDQDSPGDLGRVRDLLSPRLHQE